MAVLELDADKNFIPCDPESEFDFTQWPKWLRGLISGVPIIGQIFEGIGDKLCFRTGKKCPDGLEWGGKICYPPCKKGYVSDGATLCYKKYPEFDHGNGQSHTLLTITKNSKAMPGVPVNTCSSDNDEFQNGLCYTKCAEGYSGNGPVCWRDCEEIAVAGLCKKQCATGYHDVGGVCWKVCPEGYRDDGATCRNPTNAHIIGKHSYVAKTFVRHSYGRGVGKPAQCSADSNEITAGLCYKPCPSGYSRQTIGVCAQDCPAGARDFGVGCSREMYSRGSGIVPLGIRMKKRKEKLGKGKKF
jgi:hypothetical protein